MTQDRKLPRDVVAGAAIAPETVNREQEDEEAQTQTVADEALGRGPAFGLGDSEKPEGGIENPAMPDLVDHMHHMLTSGRIDMSAYRGERSDDDVEDYYGEQGIDSDVPDAPS